MSGARDLILAQREELEGLTAEAKALSRQLAEANIVRLERQLARMPVGSWGRASREATLAALRLSVRDLVRVQSTGLTGKLTEAALASARGTASYLMALDRTYLGVVRPLRFDTVEWLSANAKASSHRVRQFRKSFQRYGGKVVSEIEQEIARSIMIGESWVDARERVVEITRETLDGNQALVDRITRTETSAAYNGTRLRAMRAEDRPGDRMLKLLSSVIDGATGRDSLIVHGQKRPVGEPFEGPNGPFQAPPDRPRDRAMVVPWRDRWGADPVDGLLEDQPVDPVPAEAWRRHGLAPPRSKRRAPESFALQAEISRLKRTLRRRKASLPSVHTPQARALAQRGVDATAARINRMVAQLERARAREAAERARRALLAQQRQGREQLLDVLRARKPAPDLSTLEGRAAARGVSLEQQRELEAIQAKIRAADAEKKRRAALSPDERADLAIADVRAEIERFRAEAVKRAPDPKRAREIEELRKQFEAMGVETIDLGEGGKMGLNSADLDVIGRLERRVARLERMKVINAQDARAGGRGVPFKTHKEAMAAMRERGIDIKRLPLKGMPDGWTRLLEAELREMDRLHWASDLVDIKTSGLGGRAVAQMEAGGPGLLGDIRAARKTRMRVGKKGIDTLKPMLRRGDIRVVLEEKPPWLASSRLSERTRKKIRARYADLKMDDDVLVNLAGIIRHEYGHGVDYNLRQLLLSDPKAKAVLDSWHAASDKVTKASLRQAGFDDASRKSLAWKLLRDAEPSTVKGTWFQVSQYAATKNAEGFAESFMLASYGEWGQIPEALHKPLRAILEATAEP